MKKIKITIFAPEKELSNGVEFERELKDDGTVVDLIGLIDKEAMANPEISIFPLYKGLVRCFLQLIWDAENNSIYEDCAVSAYGPNREFMPLQEYIDFKLYPNSEITIIVHAD